VPAKRRRWPTRAAREVADLDAEELLGVGRPHLTDANGGAGAVELLGDHLRGGLGVEERDLQREAHAGGLVGLLRRHRHRPAGVGGRGHVVAQADRARLLELHVRLGAGALGGVARERGLDRAAEVVVDAAGRGPHLGEGEATVECAGVGRQGAFAQGRRSDRGRVEGGRLGGATAAGATGHERDDADHHHEGQETGQLPAIELEDRDVRARVAFDIGAGALAREESAEHGFAVTVAW
jgi:hypothetical protein